MEPESLFKEGVIETELNLKHVRSKQAIRKFTSDDLFTISRESSNKGLMTTAIDSMKCAIGKLNLRLLKNKGILMRRYHMCTF